MTVDPAESASRMVYASTLPNSTIREMVRHWLRADDLAVRTISSLLSFSRTE